MPIGTAMLWKVANYLWLASKNIVYASDLLYPQAFSQQGFLLQSRAGMQDAACGR